MSISLIIIGLILGGLGTLACIVMVIISLAGGKNRNAGIWAIGLLIALTMLILSIFHLARRVGQKVGTGIEWIKEQEQKQKDLTYNGDSDNATYYEQQRQNVLDSLQKYTNENLKNKVPADFYANKKAERTNDSTVVLPFIYPFSIRYNPQNYLGAIISDVNDSVYLGNISQMAFDENFVIAKVENAGDAKLLKQGRGEIEYILFDLRTREYLTFVSQAQLKDKSGKIGYTGTQNMTYLSELYLGWLDPLEPVNVNY